LSCPLTIHIAVEQFAFNGKFATGLVVLVNFPVFGLMVKSTMSEA
jgi:hypothetical protein